MSCRSIVLVMGLNCSEKIRHISYHWTFGRLPDSHRSLYFWPLISSQILRQLLHRFWWNYRHCIPFDPFRVYISPCKASLLALIVVDTPNGVFILCQVNFAQLNFKFFTSWNLFAEPSTMSPANWECCILMLKHQRQENWFEIIRIHNRISITPTYFPLQGLRMSEMNVQDKGCESMCYWTWVIGGWIDPISKASKLSDRIHDVIFWIRLRIGNVGAIPN